MSRPSRYQTIDSGDEIFAEQLKKTIDEACTRCSSTRGQNSTSKQLEVQNSREALFKNGYIAKFKDNFKSNSQCLEMSVIWNFSQLNRESAR